MGMSGGDVGIARRRAGAVAVVALVLGVLPMMASSPAEAATVSAAASADAYVSSASPNTKYGGAKQLRVSGTPTQRTYLRFNLSGVSGTVTQATLTLHPTAAAAVPLEVHPTGATWKESSVTFATAPPVGAAVVGSVGTVPASSVDIDVTSAVTGNGEVDLAVVVPSGSTSSTAVAEFASREVAKSKPTLTVTTATTPPPPDTAPPATPTGLSAVAGDGSVSLTWTANTESDLASYRVYRSVNGSGASPVLVASPTQAGFTDTGVSNGTTYDYRVSAVDRTANESAQSGAVTARPTVSSGPCSSSGDYSAGVLGTPGLAAYWRLGDRAGTTACEARGVAPGTYNGGFTLGRPGAIAGDANTAANFNGSTGYVKVTNQPALTPSSRISLEAWVSSRTTAGSQTIIRKDGQYLLRIVDGTLVGRLWWKDGTTTQVATSALLTTGSFQHLAMTYDGTALTLFRNGVQVASSPVSKVMAADSTRSLFLGASDPTYDYLAGDLDEAAVYNTALSADTIASHYRLGTTTPPPADTTPPATPANFHAAAGDTKVSLTWDANTETDLAGYQLSRRVTGDPTWGAPQTLPKTATTFTDTGLTNGTAYDYQLVALDNAGNPSTAATASATPQATPPPPDTTPPATPAGFRAAAGDAKVSLTWDANTEDDLWGYRLYRRVSTETSWPDTPTEVLGKVTSFTDSGLQNGTSYDYRLVAVDNTGNPSPAATASATPVDTTPRDTTPPAAPTGLRGTSGDGSASLTWSANTENDLAGYELYRRLSTDTTWSDTPVEVLPAGTTSFMDTDLQNGTSFDYRLSAIDTSNNRSAPSAATSVTPLAPRDTTPPDAPTGLVVTSGNSVANLSWVANTDADLDSYRVYRRVAGGTWSATPLATANGTGYVDLAVVNDTAYDYRVTAVDLAGNESAPSSAVTARPTASPCTASSDYSASVLGTAGLVAYWRLGDGTGTVTCEARGVAPGAYNGGFTLARSGAIYNDANTAVRFDGTSGYVKAPNKPALSPTTAVTVEAWARPTSTAGSQTILRKDGQYLLRVVDGQLIGRMWWSDGTVSTASTTGPVVTTASFQHLAMTYDGTAIRVYRNGVQVASTTVSKTMAADSTRSLFIGASDPTYDWFNGILDEAALYSTALSADTLLAHYRIGAAVDGAGPQEVAAVGAPEAIGVRWTAVQGATAYRVYQQKADGSWPTTPLATTSGDTSYVARGLTDGQSYAFRVTAVVNGNQSRPSDPATSTPRNDVLLAAGDIADNTFRSELTSQLLDRSSGQVMTLGDNVYPDATASDFTNYFDPTWGRQMWRTLGAIGNHEYNADPTAAPYWNYFGAAAGPTGRGYYSYDLAGWHVVVLNSNCTYVGGCSPTSPQGQWLNNDLNASTAQCTLAVWHHPLFTSGNEEGTDASMHDMWSMLMDHHADVVLNGHDHAYERFAPQDANGVASPNGMREFIVGTGGAPLYPTLTTAPNSQVRFNDTRGILRLELNGTGYTWNFVPVDGGKHSDSGSDTCH